jgi:hypothetical protein
MNTHLLSEGYIVENLDTEDLFKILERVAAVKEENLCTVQIEEQRNGELSLYGVWEMTYDEAENYHNSGGVWSYHHPDYFFQIVEDEIKRRGLYAVNVRKA